VAGRASSSVRLARLVAAAALIALVAASPASAATIGADEFIASPAAQAYKQGNYAEALRELEALLLRFPDDPTVLRYIGMANFKLGRFDDAARSFERGIGVDPDRGALRYWLGATYYELRRYEDAREQFRESITRAPGSTYAANAERFLAAVEQKIAGGGAAARPWSVGLMAGLHYDDNVSLAPSGDTDSLRFFEQAGAGYALVDRDDWKVTVEGTVYLSQHTDAAVDDFDLRSYEAGLAVARVVRLGGMPAELGVGYAYGLVEQGGDRFSQSHGIALSAEANPTADSVTRLSYALSIDAFDNDGFNAGIASRDGLYHTAALAQYVFFDRRRHYLWAAYEFEHAAADGSNFDANGHTGTVGFSATLPFELNLHGSFEYAEVDYPHFQGRNRRTDRIAASGGLGRALWDGLKAALSYSFADEDSNVPGLSTKRHVAGLFFTYDF